MIVTREPNTEPIPGYRLLEPLGRGGFGEVWKCEAPGGLTKAIKFVTGNRDHLDSSPAPADEELKAIQLVKSLRHPFLLSMERVEEIDGELVIVMELADKSLHDLFTERRAAGRPGIDRDELLGYLHEAADVLDQMNRRHGLQHLDIKPGNLFLVSGHIKVADFGLVRSLAERSAVDLGALTALYAAPELFRNSISPSSDQYSLAIVYQELLTGTLPFTGKNSRQLMLQHCTAEPNLEALPSADRPVLARALSKEPAKRFPSCAELIQALENCGAVVPGRRSGPHRRPPETRTEATSATTAPLRPANGACLPGYQFLCCQARTPFTEVWEARSPEGQPRLVKFLYGITGRNPDREREAIRRLVSLRHPALPGVRSVPGGPGCLVLVSDHVPDNLRERFQKQRGSQADGKARGLPRRPLLSWLGQAASALDELKTREGLQHLGLTPRHLLLEGDRVQLADFGTLSLLLSPLGQLNGHLQPRYSAPELFTGTISSTCDVYSLAVIFQEMLTGTPPWRGRRSGPPNLEPLTDPDRAVLSRALDAEPSRRFGSCPELIAALEEAGSGRGLLASFSASDAAEEAGAAALIAELMVEAGGSSALVKPEMWGTTTRGTLQLQVSFAARLPPVPGRAAFEPFRRQWNAQVLREGDGALTLHVGLPGSFWQRVLGGTPALVVDLQWTRPETAGVPELSVHIAAAEKGRADDASVRQVGPLLLDSLKAQLEAFPERRGRKRLPWPHPVRASFRFEDGRWSDPVPGDGKDLSLTGIGFYLPQALSGPQVRLDLTTPSRPEPVRLVGHCVRVQRCPDGRYLTGVAFE